MAETTGQIDIFEMFAEVAADDQARHEKIHGVPSLFASTTRGPAARLAEFHAWQSTWGHFDSYRTSHALIPGTCEPSQPTATCQPTSLWAGLHCSCTWTLREKTCHCVGGNLHRAACTGCDWEGENRADSDEAVCDALDHAHPGWLDDLAIEIPDRPHEKTARWSTKVTAMIGDRPQGWPVITRRAEGHVGNRCVPDRSPWGGYDVAAAVARAHLDRQHRSTHLKTTPTKGSR